MKYFFALLFILFFSFSTIASDCPTDKPFKDIKGNCYSCNDDRTFVRYPENVGIDDNKSIQYKGKCIDICPNRIEYSDGWLDAEHFCVPNTPENRITAYLIKNLMYIMFNPLNWITFFSIWFLIFQILLRILKKYLNNSLKITVKILSIIPAIIFSFYFFLNNMIATAVSIFLAIFVNMRNKSKSKNK